MPFEPPSIDTLEAFEPPPVDSLEQEETKSPGYLGPSWPAQEGEDAPQSSAPIPDEVARFFRPPTPTNALEIKPLADINAPMPEPKSFMQEVSEPLVSYQLEHPADEGVLEAVGREAANLALGVAEFPTSELGVAAGIAGTLAPTATAGAFTLQMMKDLGNQVLSTYQNWNSMTPAQKAIALTDIAGTGVLGFLTGRATAKGLHRLAKTQEAITKAEPILPQAAQAVKETKGAEYATKTGLQPTDVREQRTGDDQGRAPEGPGIGGGLQPATPSTAAETTRPAPEPKRVLLSELTPAERLTAQRALDEALGQETTPFEAKTEGATTRYNVAKTGNDFRIETRDGSYVNGYLDGEIFYIETKNTKRRHWNIINGGRLKVARISGK